ncbi:DsbA family protein [Spiractinospora alimapuensis]|nr:DsbA family protein [Spiractinospora alimapuensis]
MGHRQLVAAVERSGVDVDVHHRSFLLEPTGPAESRRPIRQLAVRSWGLTPGEWDQRRDHIQSSGRALGLRISMDSALAIDSRDAHRLIKWAVASGVPALSMWDLAFAAHLEHNENLEDPDALRALATRAGLDAAEADHLLASDAFSDEVVEDHRRAQTLGARGVPTFRVGGRVLSGHHPVDALAEFLVTGATAA